MAIVTLSTNIAADHAHGTCGPRKKLDIPFHTGGMDQIIWYGWLSMNTGNFCFEFFSSELIAREVVSKGW